MRRILLLVGCSLLAACSGSGNDDIKRWMDENTRDMRGKIAPLPEVRPYQPVPYDVEALLDPFKAQKIEPDSKYKHASGKGGGLQPDFEARELRNGVLEKYPLESLTLIGRLIINQQPLAVIKYEDKVRQVRVGEYIGLDFGMVTEIGENELKLRELIQDSAGDWSERESSLYLQGTEGSKK